MRKKLQALLVVLLLAPCPASASGTVTLGLLGPEVFTRNTGAPVPEVRSFTVPSAAGSFTLRVSSGSPEGGERVSAAVILVNGATVVEASDLNQRVTELERPLAGLLPGVNRISVEVRSIPSSFLTVSIAAEYALDVAITEPLPGAALPRGLNLVRGRFLSYTGDAGIAVNGVPAALSGGEFVASGVPLAAGTNTLTAVITTFDGIVDRDEIAVAGTEEAAALALQANLASGAAPLAVHFRPDPDGIAPVEYRYDFDGDGTTDAVTASADAVPHTFAQAGIHRVTVQAAEASGQVHAAEKIVVVEDAAAVGALLTGRWEKLSSSLRRRDTEGGLDALVPRRRERYRTAFAALGQELPGIFDALPPPRMVSLTGNVAEYRLTRDQLWGGAPKTITYSVWFVRDSDGLWRVDAF